MGATEMSDYFSQSREPILIAVVIVLLSLSVLMVGLRMMCRMMIKDVGLDDYAAVVALMCVIGSGVAMISMTRYGLGRHESTIPPETMVLYHRGFWVSITFYMMSLYWVKLSFLLNYYRLMSVSNMRLVILAAMIILTVWAVSQAIMGFVQCIPLQAVWDPRIKANCIPNRTTWWYFNGVFNIVTDFAILLLPLPIVWKLLLPLSQKIILMGIFGLGFL
ncbi:hypothetical protein AK830_g3836 [Neonectria ditissima]|uniref:Rhodopsin domain-containing protein n=1 Tax=Neonectria ditissima TaxID=78410 RepID=A0A0N8H7T7_9HYPO|nr:hypothetical protein AK830_g3836 [Neonectria ditissima]